MDLGYGLQAADAFDKSQQQAVQTDQTNQRFGWEKQKAQAGLSLLPESTEAARSGLQLQNAQNQEGIALAPDHAKVAKALADHAVADLPAKIAELRKQRVFSDADAQTAGIAKLGDLIQLGDPKQITTFLNAWGKTNPHDNNQTEISNVGFSKDPNTGENVFVATDASGKPVMQMSAAQIQKAKDSLTKGEMKVLKPGDTATITRNGITTPTYTAPVNPDLLRNQKLQHTPAEQQMVEYMTANFPSFKGNKEAAWNAYRQAREKTEASFLSDYVTKNSGMGKPSSDLVKEGRNVWQEVQRHVRDSSNDNAPGLGASPALPLAKDLLGLPN